MCDLCQGTGYITVEVPVFADGGYSDVDQFETNCRCNPAPTDEEAAAWEDVHDLPVVDYDVPNPWISIGF